MTQDVNKPERAFERVERVEYVPFPREIKCDPSKCYHVCTLYPVYLRSENFKFAHAACTKCGAIDPPTDCY